MCLMQGPFDFDFDAFLVTAFGTIENGHWLGGGTFRDDFTGFLFSHDKRTMEFIQYILIIINFVSILFS